MLKIRRVEGHSMQPNLMNGQFIAGLARKSYAVGDFVIASTAKGEIVKGITKIRSSQAYLAGSDYGHDYGWVNSDQIIAKVIWPMKLNSL